jgi:hypothetical protein
VKDDARNGGEWWARLNIAAWPEPRRLWGPSLRVVAKEPHQHPLKKKIDFIGVLRYEIRFANTQHKHCNRDTRRRLRVTCIGYCKQSAETRRTGLQTRETGNETIVDPAGFINFDREGNPLYGILGMATNLDRPA